MDVHGCGMRCSRYTKLPWAWRCQTLALTVWMVALLFLTTYGGTVVLLTS